MKVLARCKCGAETMADVSPTQPPTIWKINEGWTWDSVSRWSCPEHRPEYLPARSHDTEPGMIRGPGWCPKCGIRYVPTTTGTVLDRCAFCGGQVGAEALEAPREQQ